MKIKEGIKDFVKQHEQATIYGGVVLSIGMVFTVGYLLGLKNANHKLDVGFSYCCLKDPTLKQHIMSTIEAVNNELTTK